MVVGSTRSRVAFSMARLCGADRRVSRRLISSPRTPPTRSAGDVVDHGRRPAVRPRRPVNAGLDVGGGGSAEIVAAAGANAGTALVGADPLEPVRVLARFAGDDVGTTAQEENRPHVGIGQIQASRVA